MTATLDYIPSPDPQIEIARLRLALQVERERRVMAALWGSRDDRCPHVFALYRHENDDEPGSPGAIVAYGVHWTDGQVTLRWTETRSHIAVTDEWDGLPTFEAWRRKDSDLSMVWLSEDVDDLTEAITDGVRHQLGQALARPQTVQYLTMAVAAVPWKDPREIAETALSALRKAVETVPLGDA
ncbi:hypothetical protein JNUCC0626_19800 [Lentzea sp. JNUCC 0626]|uniref:hypothetical protein n=1 Tax=Lentzea sp. JNUCC 0626 TaxID=3367513 RepID=UPI003747B648